MEANNQLSPVGVPFCDYLSLTFPRDEVGDAPPAIVETVLSLLTELGIQFMGDGVHEVGAYGGKIYSKRRGLLWIVIMSVAAMLLILEAVLIKDMAMAINDGPHRVTRVD